MIKVLISDGVKKELYSLPVGQGGQMIKDVNARYQVSKKSEIKSIYYILAKSEVPPV